MYCHQNNKKRKSDKGCTESKGSHQLAVLNRSLCLVNSGNDSAESAMPTNVFSATTQMTKRLIDVFDLFKDNVECNLEFSENGLDFRALYSDRTVYISVHFDRTVFSDLNCSGEKKAPFCVNLGTLAKKMGILKKFKPQKLTFERNDNQLVVKGFTEKRAPSKITMNSLVDGVHELNTSSFTYDTLLRISSEELKDTIESMPSIFTIRFDVDNKCLQFDGSDDVSSVSLSVGLSTDAFKEALRFDSVLTYRACFLKSALVYLVRATKLSAFVTLGLKKEQPLYASYVITESCDTKTTNYSVANLYFSPKLEEDSDL
jgi:hypothetical protein